MSIHPLTERINMANDRGRTALIPFLTAGFPDRDSFWTHLDELDRGGADIIEIGVPFSDPVADGPVVEAASQQALRNGVTLSWILAELAKRKGRYQASLVLMGYYNPFLQYGLAEFVHDAAEAGVAGCIVPDLPLDESEQLRKALLNKGLALIPLVGVNTGRERMEEYAACSTGYAYLVSVLGTTGVRSHFPPELKEAFDRATDSFLIPVAVGFGISRPEQVAEMPIKPQAVIFGSALLKYLSSGRSAAEFMRVWNS